MKKAFITGIAGQDGSYLTELLLEKGYAVHGMIRSKSTTQNLQWIAPFQNDHRYVNQLFLHESDLTDSFSLQRLLEKIEPNEIYNLGAIGHTESSLVLPEHAANVDGLGVLRLLEAVRLTGIPAKIFQACSSELFGKTTSVPQTETTLFAPRSLNGVAKLFGFWTVVNYRESYNIFACNGILFDHESPRRKEFFVSRKITLGACRIKLGLQQRLLLGNLNEKRDWGFAKDYVEGMWRMVQQKTPDDYILATGKTASVRDFVEMAFYELGISIGWKGRGLEEKGYDLSSGNLLVEVSHELYKNSEVNLLIGDATKARTQLKWIPKTSLEQLVRLMVQEDFNECLENLKKNSKI